MKIVLTREDVVRVLKAEVICLFYDMGEGLNTDPNVIKFNDYHLPYEDLVFYIDKPEVKDE